MSLNVARSGCLVALALMVLLAPPAWAQPAGPESLEATQRRLLEKSLFEGEDLDGLIRLNQAARTAEKPFPTDPELLFPDPWTDLMWMAIFRVDVALLLENYEGLLQETSHRDWMLRLAQRLSQDTDYLSWLKERFDSHALLEVFARRQLRTIDADDLKALQNNVDFQTSSHNRAELDLLTARTYWDQGKTREFNAALDKLEAYCEGPETLAPLVIAYHCLKWNRTGRTEDLLAGVQAIVEVGRAYRPNQSALADMFWISAGDELVEFTRALWARYGASSDAAEREQLNNAFASLAKLNHTWYEALSEAGHDWFFLDFRVLDSQFDVRQGQIATALTCEKMLLFTMRYARLSDDERRKFLHRYLEILKTRRAQLAGGGWLQQPARFFPVRSDLWRGSALERLQVQSEVALWSLDPDTATASALVVKVLALSPQEEALELSLEWADSLYAVAPEQAFAMLTQAEQLALEFRFPVYRLLINERCRQLYVRSGLTAQAVLAAEKGLVAAKELIANPARLRDGRSVGDVARECSDYLASQQLAEGNPSSALQELQQGQAITSAHNLSTGARRSRGDAGALMQEVQSAKAEESVQARRQAMGEGAVTVAATKSEFLRSSRELQSQFPDLYNRTLSIEPVEFPRLQKHLPPDVILLQYFSTDTTLYIFAMTSDDLVLKSLPLAKAELDRDLMAFLRSLRRVDSGPRMEGLAKSLHDHLIGPVKAQIAGKKTLLLIPSGRLNYLPFAALVAPSGQTLSEDHELVFLGKSSDLMDVLAAGPSQAGDSMVVLADPAGDLPAARGEGEALAALFPNGLALYRDKATRQALNSGVPGRAYLHLATHGEIDSSDPNQNYLLLADGQKLRAEDIFALPLESVRMVTLSACNTALGQAEPTASVVSLAENFWVTGPGSVVATLWAVDDASTSRFMQAFYGSILAGSSKGKALQIAQRALRESAEYSHPYYWAPFVLLGDWR